MITMRIARAVMQRLLRSRVLIVAVIFALMLMGLMSASMMSLTDMKNADEVTSALQMKNIILCSVIGIMGFFANMIALILGSAVIRQDIKDATILSILSKPVSRLQYFIGSALGASFCQLIVWCIFAAVWAGLVYSLDKSVQPLHVLILFCEVLKSLLMLALTLAWAQKFSPWIAGVLALVTFDGEGMTNNAVSLLGLLHIAPNELLTKICAFPFPCFDGFDAQLSQLQKTSLEPLAMTWPLIHIIDYTALALLVAWLCFRKQDLTPNI
jgi:Cu-processing system permease protein